MLAIGEDGACSFFFSCFFVVVVVVFSVAYHFSFPPPSLWGGWIYDVIFTSFSIEFQLYQDDGLMIDDCAQWNPVYDRKDPGLKQCSNPEPLDQQASDYTTELPGLLSLEDGSI